MRETVVREERKGSENRRQGNECKGGRRVRRRLLEKRRAEQGKVKGVRREMIKYSRKTSERGK